jgi:FkbM family methyltransferase
MISRAIIVKSVYRVTRTIVPISARIRIKAGVAKSSFGVKLLEKLNQENFFTQSSVTLDIHGYEILMPERHHLKQILEREPLRENLLAQGSRILIQNEDDVFIDVGANIGDTAAVVYANASQIPNSILIEPSDFYFNYLKLNQRKFPKSEILQRFVAHEYPIQKLSGSLHHWGGTAKFIEKDGNELTEQVSQIDLIEVINPRVKLVKIDCDGMDFRILKSVIPRLEKQSPAFYFENEITSLEQLSESKEVFTLFEKAGYKYVIVARNCGALIHGGEIGESLQDILELQYVLHAQGLRSAIYYTDILVFNSNQINEYLKTMDLMRDSQKILASHRAGSQ